MFIKDKTKIACRMTGIEAKQFQCFVSVSFQTYFSLISRCATGLKI